MTTTKILGYAIISGEPVWLYASATDGTALELTYMNMAGTLKNLKDQYRGKVLQKLSITVGTPSDLDLIQCKDRNGGIIAEFIGCINVALGHVPQLEVSGLNIPITDGFALEATTSD